MIEAIAVTIAAFRHWQHGISRGQMFACAVVALLCAGFAFSARRPPPSRPLLWSAVLFALSLPLFAAAVHSLFVDKAAEFDILWAIFSGWRTYAAGRLLCATWGLRQPILKMPRGFDWRRFDGVGDVARSIVTGVAVEASLAAPSPSVVSSSFS